MELQTFDKPFFRGLRQFSDEEAERLRDVNRHSSSRSVHDRSLLDEIFAPDPITGNPSSDLYVRLSADSEVRDFIDRELLSVRHDSPRSDDSSFALDTVKGRFEYIDAYASRLRDLVNKSK